MLSVVVETDPAYEALLSLFVLHGGIELGEYEDGSMLIERLDRDTDLRDDLDAMECCGELWLSLLGIAHELPTPRTTARLADHLEAMDAVALRTTLLQCGVKGRTPGVDAAIAAAAEGDTSVVATLFDDEHHDVALRKLIEAPPSDTGDQFEHRPSKPTRRRSSGGKSVAAIVFLGLLIVVLMVVLGFVLMNPR